jgi:hypothetical protein
MKICQPIQKLKGYIQPHSHKQNGELIYLSPSFGNESLRREILKEKDIGKMATV